MLTYPITRYVWKARWSFSSTEVVKRDDQDATSTHPDRRATLVDPALFEEPRGMTVRPLDADVYALAREAAPEWDVYYLEREWRDWITELPRDPEAAFLGFCKKWFEKRCAPR